MKICLCIIIVRSLMYENDIYNQFLKGAQKLGNMSTIGSKIASLNHLVEKNKILVIFDIKLVKLYFRSRNKLIKIFCVANVGTTSLLPMLVQLIQ